MKKYFRRSLLYGIIVPLSLSMCPIAWARDYTVDPNSSGQDVFQTLEALQNEVFSLQSGDTIRINTGIDNTLTEGFKTSENSGQHTIHGHGELGPFAEGVVFLIFAGDSQSLNIIADDNKTLTFTGFVRPNERGGVFSNPTQDSKIEIGSPNSSGTLKFCNNTSDYGGAIFGLDFIEILGGTNIFSDNEATEALPDDPEDGYGGAIFGETVTISGGENTFANNNAVADGGAIHGHAITISDGNNTFTGNSAGNTGGALSGDTVTISDGNNIFSGNKADINEEKSSGGAIYGVGDVTLSGGSNSFTGNVASFGGAMYSYEGQVVLSNSDNSFENNEGVYGGAIYGNIVTLSSATNDFTDNIASFGGAMYGVTITLSGGENIFQGNKADDGGAIYAATVMLSGGDNIFRDNSAKFDGGAMYSYGNVSLTADKGDILFQGNTAGGRANAIYMENYFDDKTLSLAASSNNSIFFYDPIASDANNQNLTITINPGIENSGTVVFDTHQSNIHGNTTVYNGRMELNNGAAYGADDNPGHFTLNTGATLAINGGGSINADAINLEKGSILSFHLASYTDKDSGALILNSDTPLVLLDSVDKSLNFAVQFEGWKRGTFTLVSTGQEGLFTGFTSQSPPDIIQANDRFSLIFNTANKDSDLVLDLSFANALLTWTGTRSQIWDFDSENFTGRIKNTPITRFVPGDALIFDASGQHRKITLSQAMEVASLKINSGSYSFSGPDISSTSNTTLTDPNIANQQLSITGKGTKALFNNSSLHFAKGIWVDKGATLGGVTTMSGGLYVGAGGVLSPGNSIGAMSVDSVTFAPGSFFDVELVPNKTETSDLLRVAGTATLKGGMVRHIGLPETSGKYNPIGEWIILTAQSIIGAFDGVLSNFAFLDPELIHSSNDVRLRLTRNDSAFVDPIPNPSDNQQEVGKGLESLEDNDTPLYNQIVVLPDDTDFGQVYNELSGEIHATIPGVLQDYERDFARAMRTRLLGRDVERSEGHPLWARIEGRYSVSDASANTAEAKFRAWGLQMGGESQLDENWMAGLALRFGDNKLELGNGRHSEADMYSFGLGNYLGASFVLGPGQINLVFGGNYGFHNLETERWVYGLGNQAQKLEADYNAHSAQVFAEAGYGVKMSEQSMAEPYLGLSWNSIWSESFDESGGTARLSGSNQHNGNLASTLGFRGEVQATENLTLKVDMRWQHLFGDEDPDAELAFMGGREFSIHGAPMNRDAFGVDLGIKADLSSNTELRAQYEGYYGDDVNSHGGSLLLVYRF